MGVAATGTSREGQFAYRARHGGGEAFAGTIGAASAQEAGARLAALGLEGVEVDAAGVAGAGETKNSGDMAGQVARLGAAGLGLVDSLALVAPVLGLRLRWLARRAEIEAARRGDVAAVVRRGLPRRYRALAVAVKNERLPETLLLLDAHLNRAGRVRRAVWVTWGFPAIVLTLCSLLLLWLAAGPVPIFADVFKTFRTNLPWLTEVVIEYSRELTAILLTLACTACGLALLWQMARLGGLRAWVMDTLVMPLPWVGPMARAHVLCRWYGALAAGIGGGVELPAALGLAGRVSGSRAIAREGLALAEAWAKHIPLPASWVLPEIVCKLLVSAISNVERAVALARLAEGCEHDAPQGSRARHLALLPAFSLSAMFVVGMVVTSLILPIVDRWFWLRGDF